jgi:hypothetical protein
VIDDLWLRIEAAVAAVEPAGLAGPARPEDLDDLDVPAAWRPLWARHDGQTPAVDGLFEGWFFLPLRGAADSVEADDHGDGLPIAKDFGGGRLVIRDGAVVQVDEDGERTVAKDLAALLERVASALEAKPPARWRQKANGRWEPASHETAPIHKLSDWEVGTSRDLGGGVVAVRVASPDPRPFPAPALRIDWVLDGAPDAKGAVVSVELDLPPGVAQARSVRTGAQGYRRWIAANGRLPPEARLVVTLDRSAEIPGPRPVSTAGGDARTPAALRARAEARLSLGDASGALEDLVASGLPDVETLAMRARALLLEGDAAEAWRTALELPVGHTARLIAALAASPSDALADAEALCAHPTAAAYLWRAAARERLGDPEGAAEDTAKAIDKLDLLEEEHLPDLRSWYGRRRALSASGRSGGPAETLSEGEIVSDVEVSRDAEGWVAIVTVTPQDAERGRIVDIAFPEGGAAAVRLPPGAGHGVRARFAGVGPGGSDVRVEVRLRLPDGWAPAEGAANATLRFDRWDVIAPVRSRGKLRVAALSAVHDVELDGSEARIAGAGLAKAKGGAGDLVVVSE